MRAANELLTTIHARLTGDAELLGMIGEDGVRDRLVTGRMLPFVLIGELVSNDYSTSTERGEEHLSLSKSGSTPADESKRSWSLRVFTPCCTMRRSILTARTTSSACSICGRRAGANRRPSFMSPSCASGQ